jgi:hypothetical protein
MIGKLFSEGGANSAAVVALSAALMVLAAKGDGPLTLRRLRHGVLSNPVPRPKQRADVASSPASRSGIAA